MYKLKKDKYKSARGGYSRLLDITCGQCGGHICFYQKDGPGLLKRMYLDRMIDWKPETKSLSYPSCGKTVGSRMVYEKEKREAYRLFMGSVAKEAATLPTPEIGPMA